MGFGLGFRVGVSGLRLTVRKSHRGKCAVANALDTVLTIMGRIRILTSSSPPPSSP